MASKATHKAFNKKIVKLVLDLGGLIVRNREDEGYLLSIYTLVGPLSISLHPIDSPSEIFSIFARFENVSMARAYLSPMLKNNFNEHSGKWNIHISSDKEAINMFDYNLRRVLGNNN